MANFTTRVELHGAKTEEAYNLLHVEMAKEGFKRELSYESGKVYELPPAEYTNNGSFTAQEVVDKATVAAGKAWTGKFSVLETKADGNRAQYNLKRVR